MIRYVALLRGIAPTNPQMRNQNLRMVFESLGFGNVKTLISSENVLFTSDGTDVPALEKQIEDALQAKLGFFSSTIIRSAKQIEILAKKDYFKGLVHSNTSYLTVTFLKHSPTKQEVLSGSGYKIIAVDGREIFSIVDLSGKTPSLMSRLERQFGTEMTTRTWLTVQRIQKAFNT